MYPSPRTRGYRLRCRFAVVREGADADTDAADGEGGTLRYALFERGRVRTIDENHEDAFRAGSDAIVALMPKPEDAFADGRPSCGIAAASGPRRRRFLANRDGDVIVTLWNRKEKESETGETGETGTRFAEGEGMAGRTTDGTRRERAIARRSGVAGVVRRRKGEVTVASAGTDRVWETIRVPIWGAEEGAVSCETLRLAQPEGAFSNPNGDVAEATAAWLRETVDLARAERESNPRGDDTGETPLHLGRLPTLVELYCGNGNTRARWRRGSRARWLWRLSRRLAAAARENFKVNGVDNADVRALPRRSSRATRRTRWRASG